MTEPLSPAAQAVLDAMRPGREPTRRHLAAAALEALADQVVPEGACPDSEEWLGQSAWVQAEASVRFRILAIASELRGEANG